MVLWDNYVVNSDIFQEYYYEDHEKRSRSQLLQKVDFDELSEDYGFKTLHKIVCGIDFRDLDLEAQKHPGDLDKLDAYGRTPLWYAVTHGNTHFVRHLLERGANPNVGGSAIFLQAIQWGKLERVEQLISFGFNLTDLDMDMLIEAWGEYNARYPMVSEHYWWALRSLIVRQWDDVNRQSSVGTTMLMFLCKHQEHDTNHIDQLIRRGAELDLRNSNGETALFFCINGPYFSNPDAFVSLAHAGARLDVQDYTGATTLHYIVLLEAYKTIPLLGVMNDVDVSQFDLDARDEDGYTAFDILKKRNGITWQSYYIAKRGLPVLKWVGSEKDEIACVQSLESLFHQIQDSQGIPKEQQYPPLAPYLCEQTDNEPIPGAWPL